MGFYSKLHIDVGNESCKKDFNFVLNPSWTGLPELPQGLGGRSALPLKNSKKRLTTIFFKVCNCLHYIKIIIIKVGLSKERFSQKKVMRKNPRGGGQNFPPRPTSVNLSLKNPLEVS